MIPKIPTIITPLKTKSKIHQQQPIQIDYLLNKEKPIIKVVRSLGGIGDVIMTTPLLAKIKTLIPNCHLVYATDFQYGEGALVEVIEHCPYVDEIIPTNEAKNRACDYSVDVTTTGLSREKIGTVPPNRIDMFAEAAGLSVSDNPVPVYIVREDETLKIKEEFSDLFSGKYTTIAIQTRSNDERRTWPKENLEALIELLSTHKDFRIILLDWRETTKYWDKYNSDGVVKFFDRSISDTAALIDLCDLVVCPDSMLLHLAGALRKKIVSIFGPIPPQSRINHYENTVALTSKCRWFPCWYTPKCVSNSPTNSKLICLKNISGELVYKEILKKLDTPVKKPKDKAKDKILVMRSSRGIGDILMAANGIEALSIKYPNKEIHVACPKEVHNALLNNPYIDKLIDSNTKIDKSEYLLIFDISLPCARYEMARVTSKKPVEKNRTEIYAEAMGVRNLMQDLLPKYYPTEDEILKAKEKFNLDKSKKIIFLAPYSAEEYRNWPKENYHQLIDYLKDKYNLIVQTESIIDGVFSLTKGSTIREAGALIAISDLIVSVDTAPLHIAAALKKDVIAIFGPIDYKARCKGYNNITVLKSNCQYMPCWRNASIKCKQTGALGESHCIKQIKAQHVYNIIKDKLK